MTMLKIPGRYPRGSVTRLKAQTAHPGPLHSCQSEIIFPCPTGADLVTYNSTHIGTEANVTIGDAYQILPYSTLSLVFIAGALSVTPYQLKVFIDNAMPASAVANSMVSAFNLWVAQYRQQFRDLQSARAMLYGSNTDVVKLEMPWGMLGATFASYAGPAPGAIVPGNPGVDNPFLAGIVGPKRHLYEVAPRYLADYYGSVSIG